MPPTLPKGLPLPVTGAAVKLPLDEPSPGHETVLPIGTEPTHPSAEAVGARINDPKAIAKAETARRMGGFLVFIAATLRLELGCIRPPTTAGSNSTATRRRLVATCQKGAATGRRCRRAAGGRGTCG